tara:strand:+ start:194 stop:325 length:132 start_codon:yes stop_codon:yes gene_type:complete
MYCKPARRPKERDLPGEEKIPLLDGTRPNELERKLTGRWGITG